MNKRIIGSIFTIACIGLTGCNVSNINQTKNTSESSKTIQTNYTDSPKGAFIHLKGLCSLTQTLLGAF